MADSPFNPSEYVKAGITLLEWLESRAREMLIIFVLTLLGRFLPVMWLNHLGIDPTNPVYHLWVTRVLWGSLLYLLVFGGAHQWREAETRHRVNSRFNDLTADEKAVLKRFTADNVSTVPMWPYERGVGTLVEAGILNQASQADLGNGMFAYSFTRRARKHLNKLQRQKKFF